MINDKVMDLANKISRTKRGSKSEIKPEDPEYKILEPVVTTAMAEVGLCMELRKPKSAKEIASECGKTEAETAELLWQLAVAGAAFVNEIDGVDKYWHDIWVPGHMEMMVNNKANVKKYPQIAEAFDAYGKKKGPMTAGIFPVGTGPMRVIPIETAIQGETRRASYEEVSKYLNDNHIFSVSDCSCRTSREAMGEGCGHLKEDMCIQMGHAAEYYIRTGRGREITRDEAFEIIKRAEENGLMHSIPNTDGPGETHAICNCCGCSCFAMRIAGMFVNADMVRSNYVSKVDKEKCVACGECVAVCPTNALKLGQKICSKVPIAEVVRKDLPSNSEWGPDKWNANYRTNRENVIETGTSPCKTNCPAHISVQGYIKLAAQGKFSEALELIKHENPFPAVCGRICPRKCETDCTRGDIDDPVAIDDIKRFIAEQELNQAIRFVPKIKNDYNQKIAVIGAGPSGLSCAYYLAVEGYKVTVYEKQEKLGGMLTLGIPSYRLEKEIIDAEIQILSELGVTFKTGVEIGKDITLESLRKDEYKAFYIAIGAQNGRNLGIEGEEGETVKTGVAFLREVNLGELNNLEGDTVVIGGGNVAIDVARTATRLGSNKVTMFTLETRETMPALDEEIHEALSENVEIQNAWGPKKIILEHGKVIGVTFRRCISTKDSQGRFSPQYDEYETITIKADHVIVSVGQGIEWGQVLEGSKVVINPNKTAQADSFTLQSKEEDIFIGGDALTGPSFAIDAIAMGKSASISIHRFVQPGQDMLNGRDRRIYTAFDKDNLVLESYDHMVRQATKAVNFSEAKKSFEDLRETFTLEQVALETERCLSCGATTVDSYMCVGCGACTTRCKFDAISLVREYNEEGVALENLKPIILKSIVKRKGKIAVKKVKNLFTQK